MDQARRRRKLDVKKVKRLDLRVLYFRRRPQKSGPTANQIQRRVLLYRGQKNFLYFGHFTIENPIENWFVLGTTFSGRSTKVKCSRLTEKRDLDAWFSPTSPLMYKYSESVVLLSLNCDIPEMPSKEYACVKYARFTGTPLHLVVT